MHEKNHLPVHIPLGLSILSAQYCSTVIPLAQARHLVVMALQHVPLSETGYIYMLSSRLHK